MHKSLEIEQTHYPKDDCKIGVVHLGYGQFHKAHQAVYLDDYMEQTGDKRWGIVAVNLRKDMSDNLSLSKRSSEDYLLKTSENADHFTYRYVRSHLGYVDWIYEKEQAENLLSLTSVKIVTVTVTESGYYLNGLGDLNTDDAEIKAELQGLPPTTLYGYLHQALEKRYVGGREPLSILSCDNIRENGKLLQKNFLQYLCYLGRTELMKWIQDCVCFPSSMVDRITPRINAQFQKEITHVFGKENAILSLHAEAFKQWVIEDHFATEFPQLRAVGVEIVSDITPYEEVKIRVLNGGHTGLAYLGALSGYQTFDAAMRDKTCRQHFDLLENENILPGLTMKLPFDKYAYKDKVSERFLNSSLGDTLERLCMDGYMKFSLFIKPTLESCLAQHIHPKYCFDAIASWYVFMWQINEGKLHSTYEDANWTTLQKLLQKDKESFANDVNLWGELPKKYKEFQSDLLRAIERMESKCQI